MAFPFNLRKYLQRQSPDNWHLTSVVYQIYPRSFKDSNGDGVGDLQGIIEKLDYLNDGTDNSLGVNAIWLSPIYTSPMKDFGYDVANHKNIDPIFGDLKNFQKLVEEAHKRNIKVIMDYVPNHTSHEHPWFVESRSSLKNKKRDWYIWHDPRLDGSPPNNWLSVFGGSAWQYDESTKQYYLHTWDVSQPDLNWRNPKVVKEMLNTLKFWMDKGVDGFRADAVYFMYKDPFFRNEPPNPNFVLGKHNPFDQLLHPYTFGLPETVQMLRRLNQVVSKRKNKFIVVEVYTHLSELINLYSIINTESFAPFNFAFISLPWRADLYKQFIDQFDSLVGSKYLPTYVFGNHDKSRLVTRLGEKSARAAALLLLTLRGMPFIYYGDELGMKDGEIPSDKVQDPWEKNMPGMQLGRDPERTPMQWDGNGQAGFTDVEPWLPVATNFQKCNVTAEKEDPTSFYNLYRALIHFRKKSSALLTGDYRSYETGNSEVLAYTRKDNGTILLVVINFSDKNQKAILPFNKGQVILSTYMDIPVGEERPVKNIELRSNEGLFLKVTAD